MRNNDKRNIWAHLRAKKETFITKTRLLKYIVLFKENEKKTVYPCKPSFTIETWGLRGGGKII